MRETFKKSIGLCLRKCWSVIAAWQWHTKTLSTGQRKPFITNLLGAVALVCGVAAAGLIPQAAHADPGYTSDLSNVLTDVQITDSKTGEPPVSYQLGQDYVFDFFYQANIQYVLQYDDDDVLTYQLPSNIQVSGPVTNSPIVYQGSTVGTYSITTDGLVTVHFGDMPNGQNFIDYYLDALFTLEVTAQFVGNPGSTTIDFGNNVSITITLYPTPTQSSLSITKSVVDSKTVQGDRAASYKLNYTSTVTASDGPVSELSFWDDAAGYANLADKSWMGDVVVDFSNPTSTASGTYAYSATGTPSSCTPQTYYWVTSGNQAGFHLCFPPGTGLDQDQTMTVNYSLDYPTMNTAASQNNGAYNLTLYSVTNNAYAAGTDNDGQPLQVTAQTQTTVTRNYFAKTGVLSADGQSITWTVTLGDGVETLNGKTIYDDLGAGLSFAATPVTLTTYGADKTTPVPPSGNSFTCPVTVGSTSFTCDWPTTGPLASSDIYYATFTYATNVTAIGSSWTNTAGIIVNGTKNGSSASVQNPQAKVDGTKVGQLNPETGPDGLTHPYVDWTITMTIPAAYYGKGFFTNDYGVYGGRGYQNVPDNMVVTATFTDSDGIVHTDEPILANDPLYGYSIVEGGTNILPDGTAQDPDTYWYFYFSPGGVPATYPAFFDSWYTPITGKSVSPFPNGVTLTITYRIQLDTATCVTTRCTAGTTLYDVLQHSDGDFQKSIANQLGWSTDITNTGIWVSGYAYDLLDSPIEKFSSVSADGSRINYLVELDLPAGHPYDLGSNPVFTDTFPADTMQYVLDSFYVDMGGYPYTNTFFGPYDPVTKADLLTNYITYSPDGKYATITVPLKQLMEITGPTSWPGVSAAAGTQSGNIPNPAWSGPPTTVLAPPAGATFPANRYGGRPICVFYSLELTSDATPGQHDITNHATINGTWSSDNTVTVGAKVLTKGVAVSGNIASSTIVVNPLGQTLSSQPGSASNLYDATDKMSDTLTADLTSIQIQAKDPAKAANDPTNPWVIQPVTYSANGCDQAFCYTTTDTNEIIFTLPDITPIQITYDALVKGDNGQSVTINNTISIGGNYQASFDNTFDLQYSTASGSGSRVPVTVYKKDDADSQIKLPGAVFDLYMYPCYSIDTPTLHLDGLDWCEVVSNAITGPDGSLVLLNPRLNLSQPFIFALQEVTAPPDYQLPSDPFTYFKLEDDLPDLSAQSIPVDFGSQIPTIDGSITVLNHLFITGPALPDTGGMGTGPLEATGLLLMFTAGSVLIKPRHRTKPASLQSTMP